MALPLTVAFNEPSGQVPPPRPGPGARTTLRQLDASDAPALGWLLDPDVRRYMPDSPKSAERIAQFTAWVDRQTGVTRHLSMVITIGPDVIGLVQGSAVEPSGKTIEWGFALTRGRWGEGLMQEAGRTFLRYAVEQFGVERIEARTALDNQRAIATLRRLGARCERMIPAGLADKATDCYLWSILAADVRRTAPTDGRGLRYRLAPHRSQPRGVVLPWPAHRCPERAPRWPE